VLLGLIRLWPQDGNSRPSCVRVPSEQWRLRRHSAKRADICRLENTHVGAIARPDFLKLLEQFSIAAMNAKKYRDRGEAENICDELKNQWGWTGFTTRDLQRCQTLARMIGLIYNWWSLYTRLAIPHRHTEATTSRPLLIAWSGPANAAGHAHGDCSAGPWDGTAKNTATRNGSWMSSLPTVLHRFPLLIRSNFFSAFHNRTLSPISRQSKGCRMPLRRDSGLKN
jgi:hypothetical protein